MMLKSFFKFYLSVLILYGVTFLSPSIAVCAVVTEPTVIEHPSLMYQYRYSYVQMLFSAVARHAPDIAASTAYKEAEKLLKIAKVSHGSGNLSVALLRLNEVVLLLEALSSKRPLQERERARYFSLKEGIPLFVAAYLRHYDELAPEKSHSSDYRYSQDGIDILMIEADTYALSGRFNEASLLVQTAQEHIALAIKALLDHKQIRVVAYRAELSDNKLRQTKQELDQQHYEQMLLSIKHFNGAHLRQSNRADYQVIPFDKELVAWLLSEANALASEGQFDIAIMVAKQVYTLITRALRDTLDGQDIVVKFDISTPELEFAYEYRRYLGYEELVPIAIERMKPNAAELKLVTHYSKQGKSMAQHASKKGTENKYPVAISMILDATRSVQMALRTVGVPIYDAR